MNNEEIVAEKLLRDALKTILDFFSVKLIEMDVLVETMLFALDEKEFATEILPLSDPSDLLPRSHVHIISIVEHKGNRIKFFGKYFMTNDDVTEEAMEAYEATTQENIQESEETIRKALKLCMNLFRRYIVNFVELSS